MYRSIAVLAVLTACVLVARTAAAQDNPFGSCKLVKEIRRDSVTPEPIAARPGATRTTSVGSLGQPVLITCDDTVLSADEVIFEDDTKLIHATGNVVFQQSDLRIYAARAEINGTTKLGTFFDAQGTAHLGAGTEPKSAFGSLEPDILFYGEQLEKTGPKTYRLTHGGFTTCVQPTPRWEMTTSDATLTLDKHALLHNMVLRVKNVPLMYLPAIYYPIDKRGRSSGLLMPTYGSSQLRGTSLSNAVFLVINRSQDATIYHDWFAKTGQGIGSEYRYAESLGSQGNVNFYLLNEHDQLASDKKTVLVAGHRSYRINGDANQSLPRGFRVFGRANYFTDAATQQSYQNVYDFSQRERYFSAALSGSTRLYRLTATMEQRDLFYGTTQGQRTGRAPSASLTVSDRAIGKSRVYVGASGDATYFVRQNDIADPTTNRSMWRFDGSPTIRAALSSLSFLSVTASGSLRLTRWLESLDAVTGEQVPVALTRQLVDMQASIIGPVFSRIFLTPKNGYADRFKHIIEPSIRLQRSTPFAAFDRVVKNDYAIDGLVGGVTTLNYRLTNRVLARRRAAPAVPGAPPTPGIAREILQVDVGQTYYSDSLAAAYDAQYQTSGNATSPKGTFSPLQLTAVTRPADSTTAQFRMEIDSKYRAIRTMSASGTFIAGLAQVSAGWSKRFIIPQLPGFDRLGSDLHFLNATTTLRSHNNTVGGTYDFNLDIKDRSWLQQRVVAYYNTQCCGVSVDWQTIATPLLNIKSDRRFGVSFTLSGIGSFSNPLGSFGGGH